MQVFVSGQAAQGEVVAASKTEDGVIEGPKDQFEQNEQVLLSLSIDSSHVTIENKNDQREHDSERVYLQLILIVFLLRRYSKAWLNTFFEESS